MSAVPKGFIRQIINEGNLKTTDDLHAFLRDLFKDALQEILEAELDVELGFSKGDRKNKETDNRRNGYTDKTVKTKFGDMEIEVPRDRNGEFEPVVVPKNIRDI